MYDSKVADRLHYYFGCRIKENYLIEIRQSFLYFSYPSEKCGSRMYINQYEAVIINIVIEEMVKFSRNNFQGTSERSELIKLFIIYTRSLFLRHIRATFSHSLQTLLRIPWLPIMPSSNSKSGENQNRASFRILYIVTRAYSLEISRIRSCNFHELASSRSYVNVFTRTKQAYCDKFEKLGKKRRDRRKCVFRNR